MGMMQHSYTSKTPEAEAVACNQACRFVHGLISNFSGSDVWIFLCDSATGTPVNPTGAPLLIVNNDTRSLDWETLKKKYSSGLYVCASTNPWTKTLIVPTAGVGVIFDIAVEV